MFILWEEIFHIGNTLDTMHYLLKCIITGNDLK